MSTDSLRVRVNQDSESALKNSAVELGKSLSFYQGQKRIGVLGIGVFLVFDMFCLSVALLLSGALEGWYLLAFLLTFFVAMGVAVWAIAFYFQTANNSFTLCEQGFKYTDRHGEHEYRWEEAKDLYYKAIKRYVNGIYTGTEYEFKIVFKDGVVVKVGSNLLGKWHKGLEQLGLTVLDKTTQLLLPSYEQALEAGQPVYFGPRLVINKGKLHDRDRSVKLSDVKQIEVKQGFIQIMTHSKSNWATINVYDIANVIVFLQLARRFTSVNC